MVKMNGKSKGVVTADFGGKKEGAEAPWETANREMMEEGGLAFEESAFKEYLVVNRGAHVLFFVESVTPPTKTQDPKILSIEYYRWDEFKRFEWDKTHPRLKFDEKHQIRLKMNRLADKFTSLPVG